MNRSILAAAALAATLSIHSLCHAAGYVKFGDIKGESLARMHRPELFQPYNPTQTRSHLQPAAQKVGLAPDGKPRGLLLPAIQKIRFGTEFRPSKGGNVEYEWKVEEGE